MADTTDELIVVVEDELITAETTNKNNKYLETLMTDYAGELRQYLDNQLQTLENEFQGDLNELETTLQGSIDELEIKVDSISFAPDYANATTVSIASGGTIDWDGWIGADIYSNNGPLTIYAAINGVNFCGNVRPSEGTGAGQYTSGTTMVSKGDILTYTVGSIVIKKIPFKGGN